MISRLFLLILFYVAVEIAFCQCPCDSSPCTVSTSGTVVSINQTQYTQGMNCVWTIPSLPGTVVEFNLFSGGVFVDSNDVLYLYDGTSAAGTQLASFTSSTNNQNSVVLSSANGGGMSIVFQTDPSSQGGYGFVAIISFVNSQQTGGLVGAPPGIDNALIMYYNVTLWNVLPPSPLTSSQTVTGYSVVYSLSQYMYDPKFVTVTTANTTGAYLQVDSLLPATTYYFEYAVITSAGTGTYSSQTSFTTSLVLNNQSSIEFTPGQTPPGSPVVFAPAQVYGSDGPTISITAMADGSPLFVTVPPGDFNLYTLLSGSSITFDRTASASYELTAVYNPPAFGTFQDYTIMVQDRIYGTIANTGQPLIGSGIPVSVGVPVSAAKSQVLCDTTSVAPGSSTSCSASFFDSFGNVVSVTGVSIQVSTGNVQSYTDFNATDNLDAQSTIFFNYYAPMFPFTRDWQVPMQDTLNVTLVSQHALLSGNLTHITIGVQISATQSSISCSSSGSSTSNIVHTFANMPASCSLTLSASTGYNTVATSPASIALVPSSGALGQFTLQNTSALPAAYWDIVYTPPKNYFTTSASGNSVSVKLALNGQEIAGSPITFIVSGIGAPGNVQVSSVNFYEATVSWTAPTSMTPGETIQSYRVYYTDTSVNPPDVEYETFSGTSGTIVGLTSGDVYQFTVAAIDQNYNIGVQSNPVTVTIPQEPSSAFSGYLGDQVGAIQTTSNSGNTAVFLVFNFLAFGGGGYYLMWRSRKIKHPIAWLERILGAVGRR